jgi:UDP-N-acetylmuramoyl-tripeptide--D-alanyl-D-alanine ligase
MFRLKEVLQVTKAKLVKKSKSDFLTGVSTDSRTINKGEAFFALVGSNFNGHNFIEDAAAKGAKAIIISQENAFVKKLIKQPKLSLSILKVKDTTTALGDLAKYYRKKNAIPLIAVTGSVGKTTAKEMIYRVLRDKYNALKNIGTHNNSIGVPQTIFRLNDSHGICVLELGTNHFGEISYLTKIAQPNIAVITNIAASHLEFFKNLEGVFREKKDILNGLKLPKVVLLNGDDVFLRRVKLHSGFKIFYFGQRGPCDFLASRVSLEKNTVSFLFNKKHRFRLDTLGKFNIYNALAGIACGLVLGLDIKDIQRAINNFEFPEKRLNRIECSGFSIIDDTYNSNPLSLKSAIDSLVEFKARGRKILVMADMLELGPDAVKLHKQIGSLVCQKPIDIFVTFGKLSQSAAEIARRKLKHKCDIFSFDSKIELVDFLKSKINKGDVLLIKGSRRLQMEDVVTSLRSLR